MAFNHASLFSGIGGFDLAAEWAGYENVFHCEWNEFGKRLLNYYWPKAISYGDITTTDFTIHRGTIDVLTGGFPCQPYSIAGKRKGINDERHLWPEMLRAIFEIQPTFVVGENVPGLVNWSNGMVFEQVQVELENQGYEVIPFILPAAGIGAPHQRDRIWFIAYSFSNGQSRNKEFTEINNRRIQKGMVKGYEPNSLHGHGIASNSNGERLQKWLPGGINSLQKQDEAFTGYKPTRIFTAPNGWEKFPTQSPVCNGNDGLSDRLDGITFSKWRIESIKAGGNSIAPKLALQIFRAINEFNELL